MPLVSTISGAQWVWMSRTEPLWIPGYAYVVLLYYCNIAACFFKGLKASYPNFMLCKKAKSSQTHSMVTNKSKTNHYYTTFQSEKQLSTCLAFHCWYGSSLGQEVAVVPRGFFVLYMLSVPVPSLDHEQLVAYLEKILLFKIGLNAGFFTYEARKGKLLFSPNKDPSARWGGVEVTYAQMNSYVWLLQLCLTLTSRRICKDLWPPPEFYQVIKL